MSRVRLSRQADGDLDEIASTLGAENLSAAISVLGILEDTFLLLAKNPLIGVAREDLATNIRMFSPKKPADSYIVFYYPFPDGVEISDVIHGARDWLSMFESDERKPNG